MAQKFFVFNTNGNYFGHVARRLNMEGQIRKPHPGLFPKNRIRLFQDHEDTSGHKSVRIVQTKRF